MIKILDNDIIINNSRLIETNNINNYHIYKTYEGTKVAYGSITISISKSGTYYQGYTTFPCSFSDMGFNSIPYISLTCKDSMMGCCPCIGTNFVTLDGISQINATLYNSTIPIKTTFNIDWICIGR